MTALPSVFMALRNLYTGILIMPLSPPLPTSVSLYAICGLSGSPNVNWSGSWLLDGLKQSPATVKYIPSRKPLGSFKRDSQSLAVKAILALSSSLFQDVNARRLVQGFVGV